MSTLASSDAGRQVSPVCLHWSPQLLELLSLTALSNSHFEGNCGFLLSRPTDGIILGCRSTELKDVEKNLSVELSALGLIVVLGLFSSLGAVDSMGPSSVLTPISTLDPTNPQVLSTLLFLLILNLHPVCSLDHVNTLTLIITSSPPTGRQPFLHVTPNVRPLYHLYTLILPFSYVSTLDLALQLRSHEPSPLTLDVCIPILENDAPTKSSGMDWCRF